MDLEKLDRAMREIARRENEGQTIRDAVLSVMEDPAFHPELFVHLSQQEKVYLYLDHPLWRLPDVA
jgi:hypothetical protein